MSAKLHRTSYSSKSPDSYCMIPPHGISRRSEKSQLEPRSNGYLSLTASGTPGAQHCSLLQEGTVMHCTTPPPLVTTGRWPVSCRNGDGTKLVASLPVPCAIRAAHGRRVLYVLYCVQYTHSVRTVRSAPRPFPPHISEALIPKAWPDKPAHLTMLPLAHIQPAPARVIAPALIPSV